MALEVKLRAEIRAGEFLRELIPHEGGRPPKQGQDVPVLRDLGVKPQESKRWQRMAALPPERREEYIARAPRATQGRLLNLASRLTPAPERPELVMETLPDDIVKLITENIRLGDFQEVLGDVADNSVDLIVTDPLWGEEHLHLWDALRVFAVRVLKPGGRIAVYCGILDLPTVWGWASPGSGLEFQRQTILVHRNSAKTLTRPGVRNVHTTVYIFAKPPAENIEQKRDDVIDIKHRERDLYHYQKEVEGFKHFIEILSNPGGLIIDPFAGSGTAAVAALELDRKFIVCDNNPEAVDIARERVAKAIVRLRVDRERRRRRGKVVGG